MLKRTVSSVVFTLVMVFGIIWDRLLFWALFLAVTLTALREFYSISLGGRFRVQRIFGLLAAAAGFTSVAGHFFWGWSPRWLSVAVLCLLAIGASAVFLKDRSGFRDISLVYAGLVYIAAPVCLYPALVIDGIVFDGWMFLSLFILIWMSDVGAYCIGSVFGQRPGAAKMAPSISPRKSWVGFFGGMAFCLGTAAGLHRLTWLPFPLPHCLALGLVICLAGVAGDLFESLWKRHYGVKDSGNCIPGHGGMLDRFDSSLFAIPAAAVYLMLAGLL